MPFGIAVRYQGRRIDPACDLLQEARDTWLVAIASGALGAHFCGPCARTSLLVQDLSLSSDGVTEPWLGSFRQTWLATFAIAERPNPRWVRSAKMAEASASRLAEASDRFKRRAEKLWGFRKKSELLPVCNSFAGTAAALRFRNCRVELS
jgi:hypothetical protein